MTRREGVTAPAGALQLPSVSATLSRRGVALRVLLVALCLPLVLVGTLATAPAAQADLGIDDVVKAGVKGLRAAPLRNVVSYGGRMLPVVRGGMALLTAYQLGASALNFFGEGQTPADVPPGGGPTTSQASPSTQDCGFSITPVRVNADRDLQVTVYAGGCTALSARNQGFSTRNSVCRYPAGNQPGYAIGSNGGTQAQVSSPGSVTLTVAMCPAGSVLDSFEIQPYRDNDARTRQFGTWSYYPGTGSIPAADWTSTTSVNCVNQSGTVQTLTRTLVGQPGVIASPSCWDLLGPGWVPERVTVRGGPKGGAQTTLLDEGTQNMSQDYPFCCDAGQWSCRVKVYISGQPCTIGQALCDGFWQERDDARLSCRLANGAASYVIAWSNCSLLKRVYDTGAAQETPLVPDGQGSVQPNPITVVVNPNPNPGGQPSSGPTTGTGTPTTGANPTTDPSPTPTPATPPNSSSCWGEAWGWNPIDWIFIPVKCALMWAFVPPPGYWEGLFDEWGDALTGGLLGEWSEVFGGLVPDGGVSSDCQGPQFTLDLYQDSQSVRPFAACSGGGKTAALFVYSFALAGIVWIGIVQVRAALVSAFGVPEQPHIDGQYTLF